MVLPTDWIATALKVTGHFEDSDDPLAAVTGDFDQMGISLGVLQWNIGAGSLQPMIRNLGQPVIVSYMPTYGRQLWLACTSAVGEGLSIVRGWQNGATLRPAVLAELKALVRGKEFTAEQIARATQTAERAYDVCDAWLKEYDNRRVTLGAFCWFFDVRTQNGGLKGVTPDTVRNFVKEAGAGQANNFVCDWLAARGPQDAGYRDSRKNAELWRNNQPADKMPLFAASYLRALKSRTVYRGDVLNRKATIALGKGWVHGELHRLESILGT